MIKKFQMLSYTENLVYNMSLMYSSTQLEIIWWKLKSFKSNFY